MKPELFGPLAGRRVLEHDLYPTRDGKHVLIAANNESIFARYCEAIERPDLSRDARFASLRSRVAHVDAIDAEVGRWTSSLDSAEIIRRLDSQP